VEERLKLVVNRAKSRTAPLKECAFLGFTLGARGKVVWTAKALERFKRRVKEITRRNRGHRVRDVIDELRRYATGWMNYFGISHTYKVVLELDQWIRRRARLYLPSPPLRPSACPAGRRSHSVRLWKAWKSPRTRRRHLIALGISPEEVRMASRSRKGYWRMSGNGLVQRALSKRWLEEQGVPVLRSIWIDLHYGEGSNA